MLGRFPGIQAPFVPYSWKVTIFIISQIFIFLVYWNIQQKNTLVQAGFCYVRLIFLVNIIFPAFVTSEEKVF